MLRILYLDERERAALDHLARTDPKPYRRERAAALLKIADGEVAADVARTGLLRPRDPDTVYSWLDRYERDGLAGLTISPGRGRKPAFFPPPSQVA
jgi:transposase